MFNNIKLKTLGVHKRKLILVFLLVISMITMVACESKPVQVTTSEFELASCYIEQRSETNIYGGVLRTHEYIHYTYIDGSGNVRLRELIMGIDVNLKITENTPRVVITGSDSWWVETTYTFYLTREMYNNLYTSQK